jgi:hypothetical protein
VPTNAAADRGALAPYVHATPRADATRPRFTTSSLSRWRRIRQRRPRNSSSAAWRRGCSPFPGVCHPQPGGDQHCFVMGGKMTAACRSRGRPRGHTRLLDHPRLASQLCGLESRTMRGGRDSIDHRPRRYDDVANAATGALVAVALARAAGFRGGTAHRHDSPRDLESLDELAAQCRLLRAGCSCSRSPPSTRTRTA